MKAEPGQPQEAGKDNRIPKKPFLGIIEIESPDERPTIDDHDELQLGHLCICQPTDRGTEQALPNAYAEMVERAPRLVIKPVTVTRLGTTRMVYLIAAADEAIEKSLMFAAWANSGSLSQADVPTQLPFWHEFAGSNPQHIIGWWAIGYHVAWALSAEMAARIITEGFCAPQS